MPYSPCKKAALLIPFNEVPHLFVVLNNPDSDGSCLLVMVTSVKPNRKFDATCILEPGCHEFVRHQSYMLYRLASCTTAKHITNMVERKLYIEKPNVSDDLFKAICDGLYASEQTPNWVIAYGKKLKI